MLRSTAEAAAVDVRVEGDPSAWPLIEGDPVKLRQVFVNLIGNAIKFTRGGGRVVVSADLRTCSLEIRIKDTGIGMSAEDIPLVLQPFYRVSSTLDSQHQGAGLGLPFSKSIVELHGGTLSIESELGTGTTVTITLPIGADTSGAVADVPWDEVVN